jgi:hypothetical protein
LEGLAAVEPLVTDTDQAVLTDDEIVALSRRFGRPWRAVLPSLDPGDADGLAQAAFRGERSLLARGLLSATDADLEIDPDLAGLVSTAVSGEVTVSAFTADRELTFDPSGFTYLNYSANDADEVLVEVVAGIGLHRFGQLTRGEAAAALTTLAGTVHGGSQDPAEGRVSDTLCLALPALSPAQRTIFAVRPGVVETGTVTLAELQEVSRRSVPLQLTELTTLAAAVEGTYGR